MATPDLETHFTANPSFCVLPWLQVCTSIDGVFGRCCLDSSLYDTRGYYLTSERPRMELPADSPGCIESSPLAVDNPGKIESLRSVFNSAAMKETRTAMLAGRRLAACAACYKQEAQGGRSIRQYSNARYRPLVDWSARLQATSPSGEVAAQPVILDLRLGNQCNLRCRMCSYPTSHAWRHAHPEVWQRGPIDPFTSHPAFWEEVRVMAPDLSQVYLAGGEPLLQPAHWRLLESLVDWQAAGHIDLIYNSNLTVLPERVFSFWPKFRSVSIGASCDGVGAVFEHIRTPAKWDTFVENIRRVRAYAATRLSVTVQRDNLAHLGDLWEWAAAEDLPVDLDNVLQWPPELSIQTLPRDVLQRCVVDHSRWAERFQKDGRLELAEEIRRLTGLLRQMIASSSGTTSGPGVAACGQAIPTDA